MLDDEILIGLTVHVLEPTTALRTTSPFASAVSLKRGDVLVLTEDDIEASKNRNGESSWAIADDPELQRLRFGGKEIVGVGPWPQELLVDRDDLESVHTVGRSSRIVNRSAQIAVYRSDF